MSVNDNDPADTRGSHRRRLDKTHDSERAKRDKDRVHEYTNPAALGNSRSNFCSHFAPYLHTRTVRVFEPRDTAAHAMKQEVAEARRDAVAVKKSD
jgi:hypothetical protein